MERRSRQVRRFRRRRWPSAVGAVALGALVGFPASAEVSSHNDAYDPVDPQAAERLAPTLQQSFADLDAMLFPPWELEQFPAVDASASCETIYRELNERVPKSYSYRKRFTDNPINSLIGALGTMWWPAWLLWIIPEVARYRDNRHIENNKARVTYLRQLSAEKECWVK